MGFWSSVFSIGKALLGGIAKTVLGGVVSWITENILGLGDTPRYDPKTSTVDETKKINELIQKCVSNYGEEAKRFEKIAKQVLNYYMKNIYDTLEPFKNNNIIPEYVFLGLEKETEFLVKNTDNMYLNKINNVFSLNNNKLLDILKLDKGTNKNKKIQMLAIDTLQKTNDKFIEGIKKFLSEQQNSIVKQLEFLKEERIKEGNNTKEQLENIQKQKEKAGDLTETIDKLKFILKKLEKIQVKEENNE